MRCFSLSLTAFILYVFDQIMSRGQRALSLAKKRSMKTAQINLVTKANEWGIKVWSVKSEFVVQITMK